MTEQCEADVWLGPKWIGSARCSRRASFTVETNAGDVHPVCGTHKRKHGQGKATFMVAERARPAAPTDLQRVKAALHVIRVARATVRIYDRTWSEDEDTVAEAIDQLWDSDHEGSLLSLMKAVEELNAVDPQE